MICRLALFKNDTGIHLKHKVSNDSSHCSNKECAELKKCKAANHISLKLFERGDYGWMISDRLNIQEIDNLFSNKKVLGACNFVHPINESFWVITKENEDKSIIYSIYSNKKLISECNTIDMLNFVIKKDLNYDGIVLLKEILI